jgi:hypothetical protein
MLKHSLSLAFAVEQLKWEMILAILMLAYLVPWLSKKHNQSI